MFTNICIVVFAMSLIALPAVAEDASKAAVLRDIQSNAPRTVGPFDARPQRAVPANIHRRVLTNRSGQLDTNLIGYN
jgi:hypothetical protein